MSPIPDLTRNDVLAAMAQIQRTGVPRSRRATKFQVVHDGFRFPPKYVISIASQIGAGRELRPSEFSGGPQSNTLLESLGFTIELKPEAGLTRRTSEARSEEKTILPIRPTQFALVARVVLEDWEYVEPADGEEYLMSALGGLTENEATATFLVTPGGFVHAPLPQGWTGTSGWASTSKDLDPFLSAAQMVLRKTVTERVLQQARGRVDVVTVGVDVIGQAGEHGPHAELVAVVDVKSGDTLRWTGKSYPTATQEQTLVHVTDLESHCLEVAGERVLVLGCHDLNVFNPRGRANRAQGGLRQKRCDAFERVAKEFHPTVVLQHPHTTDSPNIWRNAWARLLDEIPSVRTWASGIRYYNPRGEQRGDGLEVLEATASSDPPPWDILALLE